MERQQSKGSTQKWLIGCGIGCGVIIIILMALGIGGFFFVRNIVQEFQDMDDMTSTLAERYGSMKEYCPEPDGTIKPDRIEAFLSVREAFAPARKEMEKTLTTLSQEKSKAEIKVRKPRPGDIFKMIRLGVGVIPQIADYFKSRNKALLDAEMGLGEYCFIYTVAYYSWLGKKPEDGPDFRIMESEDEDDFWDEDREEVLEVRRDRILRRIHRVLLPMLRNQYEKLISGGMVEGSDEWRRILEAEIKAMEADLFRLLWRDGLPEVLEASLQPFHKRLEVSYSVMTNPLEVAFEQR